MKKLIAAVLALTFVFSLAGCAFESNNKKEEFKVPEFTVPKIDLIKNKTFSSHGLQITLPENFRETVKEGYTFTLESDSSGFFANKDPFTLTKDFEVYTLEDFAEVIYQSNADKSPTQFRRENSLLYMEYESTEGNTNYSSIIAVFEGSDAFWGAQFVCKSDEYMLLKQGFIKWLNTVEVE